MIKLECKEANRHRYIVDISSSMECSAATIMSHEEKYKLYHGEKGLHVKSIIFCGYLFSFLCYD